MYTPLRLTWTLSSPICVGRFWPTADAVIAAAFVKEKKAFGLLSDDGNWEEILSDLPIEKIRKDNKKRDSGLQSNNDWVYKASYLMPHQILEHEMNYLTKHHNLPLVANHTREGILQAGGGANVFDTARTITKNAFVQFPTLLVEKVSAYVVGDANEIERLLDFDSERGVATGQISALGSRTARGYGAISKFEIAQDETALSHWINRPLLWEEKDFTPIIGRAQNPYWEKTDVGTVFVPPLHPVQFNEEVKIYEYA